MGYMRDKRGNWISFGLCSSNQKPHSWGREQANRLGAWNTEHFPVAIHRIKQESGMFAGIVRTMALRNCYAHSRDYWHVTIEQMSATMCTSITVPLWSSLYTGCNRRNVRDFGRVFLGSDYTDITQNIYIQRWTVTELMAIKMCGLLGCRRTVRRPWRNTCPMRLPGNETW